MDERPKGETGNHQNARGKQRQQLLWPPPEQFHTRHVARGKENKSKSELLGIHQDKNFCSAKEHSTKLKGSL